MADQAAEPVGGGVGVAGTTTASAAVDSIVYPKYDQDEETFASFLQQHTILTQVQQRLNDDDDDDDDDIMLEPTAEGSAHSIRRGPCFLPHLQRIKDRHFYNNDVSSTSGGNSANVFIIQIPLDELSDWDAVRGGDLADRAAKNTVRYQELFASVIDKVLSGMQHSTGSSTNGSSSNVIHRDTVDILHEHRLAQQAAREAERGGGESDNTGDGGIHNPFANAGNLEEEENNNGNSSNTPGGATEDFPAVLMRRYELRILPKGRRGTLPPFVNQYLPKTTASSSSSTTAAAGDSAPTTPNKIASSSSSATGGVDGVSMRSVRSRSMGRLVTIRGMIVRSSDVKPFCVVATYSCDACGVELYQVVQNKREFMPCRVCPSQACQSSGAGGRGGGAGGGVDTLHLQTRGSKFVKFQELKLQELPSQVPMGHVPRSMSVYCRGELTRLASPGDVVTIDGVFLPQRLAESGYRAMKAGLISTTYLEAMHMIVHKKSYDESLVDSMSEEESAKLDSEIMDVATGEDPIGRLSSSLAPEIFGHEDIKRSLLLQLVGGCTRSLPDGMRIRGDINICLMGDPGVAKSQLLKHVASIAPRGVYTTGKGSSGVGLTAAVTKDLATGEMSLEGGALVLADRGICAIDEFDKMDESDRTAIHEVMEQQTVSIAKAGIVATLNARAAVLAAANPLYGRYNRGKSLSENVNLPNSLLSRFDLLFLVLDIANVDRDMALARHVTFVHQNVGLNKKAAKDSNGENGDDDEEEAEAKKETVTAKVLREYISRARKHHPVMPPDVAPYVVEAYVSLRMEDRPGAAKRSTIGDQTAMTARQLLSILRLSQALSRLRFSDFVAREDVDEAIRLTHMSKASLLDEDGEDDGGFGKKRKRGEDVMSRIFNIIRDYASTSGSTELELKLCEAMVLRKGFTAQQLKSCLEEYEALQVIQISRTRTHVYFIDGT